MGANTVSECLRQGQIARDLTESLRFRAFIRPPGGWQQSLVILPMIITHRIALDPNDSSGGASAPSTRAMPGLPGTGASKNRGGLWRHVKSRRCRTTACGPAFNALKTAAGAVVFGTEPERSEVRADRSASDVGQVLASPRGGRQGWSEARAPLPGAALQVTQAGYDLPGGQRAQERFRRRAAGSTCRGSGAFARVRHARFGGPVA